MNQTLENGIQFHEDGRFEEAVATFQKETDKKHPIATYLYALHLREGWGCERNEKKAFELLKDSTEMMADYLDKNHFNFESYISHLSQMKRSSLNTPNSISETEQDQINGFEKKEESDAAKIQIPVDIPNPPTFTSIEIQPSTPNQSAKNADSTDEKKILIPIILMSTAVKSANENMESFVHVLKPIKESSVGTNPISSQDSSNENSWGIEDRPCVTKVDSRRNSRITSLKVHHSMSDKPVDKESFTVEMKPSMGKSDSANFQKETTRKDSQKFLDSSLKSIPEQHVTQERIEGISREISCDPTINKNKTSVIKNDEKVHSVMPPIFLEAANTGTKSEMNHEKTPSIETRSAFWLIGKKMRGSQDISNSRIDSTGTGSNIGTDSQKHSYFEKDYIDVATQNRKASFGSRGLLPLPLGMKRSPSNFSRQTGRMSIGLSIRKLSRSGTHTSMDKILIMQDIMPLCIFELGICYLYGWGTHLQPEIAAHYIEISAIMGETQAQDIIGHMYETGNGVKKSKSTAAKFYRMNPDNLEIMPWIMDPKLDTKAVVTVGISISERIRMVPIPKEQGCSCCKLQ